MWRSLDRVVELLLSLLLFLVSSPTLCQSVPPEEILQWEADMLRFDSLNQLEESDAGTLLVTGSSSVRLWDSIHLDLAPYRIMQRGYGGAKLTDFNYYADRIIKPQRFKAIVVFVANDISGGETDSSPRELRQLFRDLVRRIRERNPETPVCWIETTPTPSRWHASPDIRESNALIARYCANNVDLHFISTFDYFTTPEGLPDSAFFREDMLHLNREGYRQWSSIIKSSLQEAGIDP